MVGFNDQDDAAVIRLSNGRLLVQTVDFFTPIVDDPYQFGQIAAANSLSDIYAMGGTPQFALNIVGFPINDLPKEMLTTILQGGADKAQEAGISIVGGHSVDDKEPKYGMVVTGEVDEQNLVKNDGAKPGDILVLTKPIGTGIIATAIKKGIAVLGGIIDEEYRGEIKIILINHGDKEVIFRKGDAIAQGIVYEIPIVQIKEEKEISTDTDRGEGGFGSTGE